VLGALAAGLDQAGTAEHGQVLRGRLLRHLDLGGDFPDRAGPSSKQAQDLDASRFTEGLEGKGGLLGCTFHKYSLV